VTDMDVSKLTDLLNNSGIIQAVKLDVLKKEDVQNLVQTVGRVDVVFNCAG
jgi:NADP-dependent 3-hydroxy acid dehydrogenase YdfG